MIRKKWRTLIFVIVIMSSVLLGGMIRVAQGQAVGTASAQPTGTSTATSGQVKTPDSKIVVIKGDPANVKHEQVIPEPIPEDPKKRYAWHVRWIGNNKFNIVMLRNYRNFYLEKPRMKLEQYLEHEKTVRKREEWAQYYAQMIQWVDQQKEIIIRLEQIVQEENSLGGLPGAKAKEKLGELSALRQQLSEQFRQLWQMRPSSPDGSVPAVFFN